MTNSAIHLLFNGPEVMSSASGKAKLFAKNFSRNYNLDDSRISLPVFSSRTNLKLHNIPISSQLIKKVTTNLDLLNASSPDSIPVVVFKKCEPELSYILAELFNMCLTVSCFPEYWNVSSVVPVFKNVGERCTAKNYRPVNPLSVVNKVFDKLVNNRLVNHPEKGGLFSDFQYGFRPSRSTADLQRVVSGRLATALIALGLLELLHLTYARLWTGCDMLVFFTNFGLVEFRVRYLALCRLFSVIAGFEWFWMGSPHRNIPLMLEFLEAPFLVMHFFCNTLMTFLMKLNVILLSMRMILLNMSSLL